MEVLIINYRLYTRDEDYDPSLSVREVRTCASTTSPITVFDINLDERNFHKRGSDRIPFSCPWQSKQSDSRSSNTVTAFTNKIPLRLDSHLGDVTERGLVDETVIK
ncbi:hypothetical protein J6590_000723 [Homalodisca vitripennis]|nr:hypothetical protein J6590_000723 [Homalodisca vitripennis]